MEQFAVKDASKKARDQKPAKQKKDKAQANPTLLRCPSIWSFSFKKFKNLCLLQAPALMLIYSSIIFFCSWGP